MQMDILPELDAGGLPNLPDNFSPQAAAANHTLLSDGQGEDKIHSSCLQLIGTVKGPMVPFHLL